MRSTQPVGLALPSAGQTLAVGDLARIYGFTDDDGRQPTPYVIEE